MRRWLICSIMMQMESSLLQLPVSLFFLVRPVLFWERWYMMFGGVTFYTVPQVNLLR